eukprot:scaffold713_cov185-Ochromonas_danica.AAC.2
MAAQQYQHHYTSTLQAIITDGMRGILHGIDGTLATTKQKQFRAPAVVRPRRCPADLYYWSYQETFFIVSTQSGCHHGGICHVWM